jgi:hypothetical protein
LDAVKMRLREEVEGKRVPNDDLRSYFEASTSRFSSACEDAIKEMGTFLQFTEAAHCLQALMTCLTEYHAEVASILAE